MTPAEIATLKALCDAATPGPWRLEVAGKHLADVTTDDDDIVHNGRTADARLIAAARAALPAALSALEEARAALAAAEQREVLHTGADRLADEVAVLVRRRVIDARSPAGDALLDYRDPPSTPRADRLAAAESRADALQAEVHRLGRERVEDSDGWIDSMRATLKELDEARARADAAWRAVEAARALSVRWEAKGDAPRRYSYPEADAADGAERDTYRRCADDLKAALPPPSATQNEET